jgi:hypothetical protein
MATMVAGITKAELKAMIEKTVERKLLELIGDPDQGLVLKKSLRERLVRQQKAVAAGRRGESLEDVARRVRLH